MTCNCMPDHRMRCNSCNSLHYVYKRGGWICPCDHSNLHVTALSPGWCQSMLLKTHPSSYNTPPSPKIGGESIPASVFTGCTSKLNLWGANLVQHMRNCMVDLVRGHHKRCTTCTWNTSSHPNIRCFLDSHTRPSMKFKVLD
jgi:hypothetical protein